MAGENSGEPTEVVAPTEDSTPTADPAPTEAVDAKPASEPAKAATALEDPDSTPIATPTTWPEDWRAKMAKGDKKHEKRLERFNSPQDVLQSYLNLEAKLSRGEEPDPFPGDGSDEDKSAWRKSHKIPESAQGYLADFTLENGLVIGDQDQEMVGEYLDTMHQINADPDAVQAGLNWHYKNEEMLAAKRLQKDDSDRTNARDELRDEMGAEFSGNLQAGLGLLDEATDDVRSDILGARLPDGSALGNNPGILRFLIGIAKDINPAATITPGSRGDTGATIGARIGELEKLMADRGSDYYKSDEMQAEYRTLVSGRDKLAARQKAAG